MTQCNCSAARAGTAACTQVETDAMETLRTVSAGEVCGSECAPLDAQMGNARLAMIQFPIQTYRTGFCPCEALQKGTLFPELVSPYQRGC